MGVCYCSLLFFGSSFIPAEFGNVSGREEVQEREYYVSFWSSKYVWSNQQPASGSRSK